MFVIDSRFVSKNDETNNSYSYLTFCKIFALENQRSKVTINDKSNLNFNIFFDIQSLPTYTCATELYNSRESKEKSLQWWRWKSKQELFQN